VNPVTQEVQVVMELIQVWHGLAQAKQIRGAFTEFPVIVPVY
jgi:hypothetical protein